MAGEEIQRQRGRGRFEIWSQQRYRRWSAPASACSPARIISREPLALFMPKNTHIHARSHTFLPPDFISKTACRALGVIGCPFSLLMASGEGRRERTRGQLVKLLSFITKLHLNLTFWLVFFSFFLFVSFLSSYYCFNPRLFCVAFHFLLKFIFMLLLGDKRRNQILGVRQTSQGFKQACYRSIYHTIKSYDIYFGNMLV